MKRSRRKTSRDDQHWAYAITRFTKWFSDTLWKLGNNWYCYAGVTGFCIAVLVVELTISMVPKHALQCCSWLLGLRSFELHTPEPVLLGIVESAIASIWFAWTVYLNRVWIKTIFQPKPIRLLAPISIATTPLIVGKEQNVWDNHGINVQLDFSATGNKALEKLRDGSCELALAGDFVICKFFSTVDWRIEPYFILPFVRIKNEIKLLVPPKSSSAAETPIASLDDLQGKKIAYWKSSIHEEFLRKNELECTCSTPERGDRNNALMDFMAQTSSGDADACVLVEPYFIAFENARYEQVRPTSDMCWYMCLVFKQNLFEEYPDLDKRLPRALTEACSVVTNNWESSMRSCAHYVLQELTGIDEQSLQNIKKENLHFGIPRTPDEFLERLDVLCAYDGEVGKGAVIIRNRDDCLLPDSR